MNTTKEINWMNVARKYWETDEFGEGTVKLERGFCDKERILKAMGRMKWEELYAGKKVAFMPGEGIKSAIQQLKIPKVSHIAISHDLAPYGFYGIRGHYKNADADIFIIDTGTMLTCCCQEVEYR